MAQKEVGKEEFGTWYKLYQEAVLSTKTDKEEVLDTLYDQMETALQYVGSSAIEDLLQEEVPETIQGLMSAGIKVWVLTGDKQETAIEIGKSCNLINEKTMELVVLSAKDRQELDLKLGQAEKKRQREEEKGKMMSIVIDGFTLTIVLEEEALS